MWGWVTVEDMTESQHMLEGLSNTPRIKPAEEGDKRPVSVSARLGRLQFHNSGKFRVLQVSDIQDGAKVSKDTIALIAASLDTVRPDVVVFTGNQIAGYDPAFSETFVKRSWNVQEAEKEALERTRQQVRGAIEQFLTPLIERGVPFAVTYGNHDSQCGLTNAQLDEIYRSFPGCLNPVPSDTAETAETADAADDAKNVETAEASEMREPGESLLPKQTVLPFAPGTFALPVLGLEGAANVLALALLDSGGYARGGGFAKPSREALAFLQAVPHRLGVSMMLFQHMPIPQYYDLLKPVKSNAPYAMQGYRGHAGQYYVLDGERTQVGGYLGEGISCPDESEEFDLLHGSLIGISAGHDHRNGFVGDLDGTMLLATPTCGFDTYGPAPDHRATRLIEFDIRHPHEPRTQLLTFGELVGKPSSKKAYTYAINAKPPQDGEGDDLLRKPSLVSRLLGLFGRK